MVTNIISNVLQEFYMVFGTHFSMKILILTSICITSCFIVDTLSTYFFLRKFRKEFPDKEWVDIEHNPNVKYFMRKYGLGKGTIYSIFVTYLLVIPIIIISSFSQFMFGLMIGTYLMLFRVHMITWSHLYEGIKNKNFKKRNSELSN